MISTQTNAKKTRGRVGIAAISTLVIMCSMLTACGETTKMNSDFAGGDGSVSSPYQIETAEQLDKVREHLDSSFILESDIDLFNYDNWSPIGTFESLSDKPEDAEVPNPEAAFTGNFDGNGHMISHVTVNEPQSMAVGLFGCVAGTETAPTSIKNLKVSDVSITGGYLVGGAAGLQFTHCTIENVSLEGKNALQGCQGVGGVVGTGFSLIKDCTATADITVLGDDGASAGIVVGGATYSSITGCTASGGSISAEGNACWGIGSICGAPYASSEITDCSAHNITISATGANNRLIGGLVGFAGTYADDTGAVIQNCEVDDVHIAVSDTATCIGGIVGGGKEESEGSDVMSLFSIKNCNVSGEIKGGAQYIGSVIGNPGSAREIDCSGTMGELLQESGSAANQ